MLNAEKIIDSLYWVIYAIQQQNTVGAQSVLSDIIENMKINNSFQANIEDIHGSRYKYRIISFILKELMSNYDIDFFDLSKGTNLSLFGNQETS